MSRRIIRSTEPNRNSETALASSVLPVPVGPANRNTPIGLLGSFRPALSMAMRAIMASTASSWPITRAAKKSRIDLRSSCSLVSRIETGRPENCDSVSSTRRAEIGSPVCSARIAVSLSRNKAEPGSPLVPRYWLAVSSAILAQSGSNWILAQLSSSAITSRTSNNVAAGDNGSSVTVSNRPRSDGLSCTSRAVPLAVASHHTISRPAAIAGMIWSSMVALWPECRPLMATCTISGTYQISLWPFASSSTTWRMRPSSWPI